MTERMIKIRKIKIGVSRVGGKGRSVGRVVDIYEWGG